MAAIMDITIKLLGLAISSLSLYKIINEILNHRTSRAVNTYKLSKKFIDDCKNTSTHQLIIEHGFTALTGKRLSYDEILFLISKSNPSKKISDRLQSIDFIKFDNNLNSYTWNTDYIKDYDSKFRECKYKSAYFICSSAGIYPIISNNSSSFSNAYIVSFILSMFFVAIINLINLDKFKTAKTFMQNING